MMRKSEENRAFKVVCWTALLALVVQPVPMAFAAGDGTFGPNTDFPTGVTPLSVALADVDGDGDLDVVTANPIRTTSRCCSATARAVSERKRISR